MFLFVHSYCKTRSADFCSRAIQTSIIIFIIIKNKTKKMVLTSKFTLLKQNILNQIKDEPSGPSNKISQPM